MKNDIDTVTAMPPGKGIRTAPFPPRLAFADFSGKGQEADPQDFAENEGLFRHLAQ